MGAGAHAARRFSGNSNFGRVAPEGGDVALHPPQRGLLIQQAVIARRPAPLRAQGRQGQPAQGAQPVVQGHHHDAILPGQFASVVAVARPGGVRAAVNPDHHRQPALRAGGGGSVDVQVQAVFLTLDGAGRLTG